MSLQACVPISSVFQTSSFISAIMQGLSVSGYVQQRKEQQEIPNRKQEGSWAVALGEGMDQGGQPHSVSGPQLRGVVQLLALSFEP